jgi:hypothetical protein
VASGQLTTLICALAVNSVGPAFSIGSSIWTLRAPLRPGAEHPEHAMKNRARVVPGGVRGCQPAAPDAAPAQSSPTVRRSVPSVHASARAEHSRAHPECHVRPPKWFMRLVLEPVINFAPISAMESVMLLANWAGSIRRPFCIRMRSFAKSAFCGHCEVLWVALLSSKLITGSSE